MKRPASQYYWGDWRKDLALQSCSLSARGLWHEMNCLMHEGVPYGHLAINGNAISTGQLARLVGVTERECKSLLAELEAAAIYSVSAEGLIYSRRMVRDEELRQVRANGGAAGAEHGAKGGSHGIKGGRPRKEEAGLKPPSKPPLEPPPSSSSSASLNTSSLRSEGAQGTRLPENWEPDDANWKFAAEQLGGAARACITLDSFRDYWASKPGKDGRKSDWQATWRNWIRRENSAHENRSPSRAGSNPQPRKLSLVEQAALDRAAFAKRVGLVGSDDEPLRPHVDKPPRDGAHGGGPALVEGDFRYVSSGD